MALRCFFRPGACLGRSRTDRLCDARNSSGEGGRLLLQEEYAEWRVLRDADGPVRFELTTELADYWEILARHAPRRLVELVTEFAGEDSLSPREVFGGHDPFGEDSTEEGRAEAFSSRWHWACIAWASDPDGPADDAG